MGSVLPFECEELNGEVGPSVCGRSSQEGTGLGCQGDSYGNQKLGKIQKKEKTSILRDALLF